MIEHAIKMAKRSSEKQQIGCVITDKKGRVIAAGYNRKKTHPLQAQYAKQYNPEKIYLHAEIDAIIKLKGEIPHTLYVGRIMKSGDYGIARPCPICMAALIEVGVKRVVFTNKTGEVITYELTD